MLLAEIVDAVAEVSATRSRRAKVDALADLLGRTPPAQIETVVGLLTAQPRQGRLGVGWRSLQALRPTHAAASALDVADVDTAFSALAATSGSGSAARRTALLDDLAARATAPEWDLVTRIVRGELRTGALEGVLVDALARSSGQPLDRVRRAAMLVGDLGETARIALTDPGALASVGLRVGRPVLPMLAATAESVTAALTDGRAASVEYKLDGARIQVHRGGDDVRVFTRSLADVTARVPEIVAAVRTLPAGRLILDGETLALDEDGGPRAFQDTMARFGAESGDIVLRPWFFDVLHVDGRDLLDEPLSVRQAELERVAGAFRVPARVTTDAAEGEEFARAALAAGHEGVMVKALDAPYAAGRRGDTWRKVKPVHTFDLVVLAVERGSGRRAGWLSNIHLGALDPAGQYGPAGGFVMVGKTFKGMTDEILRWQSETFPALATDDDGYVLTLSPVTAVEVAIDGVQRSPRYPAGLALRFARVKRYRPDKRAADADTIGTLRAMLPGRADVAVSG
ncbi:ATP-dependent DNA ligase [Microbacterium sp. 10M-3C3]|uniref:ATP-dependent DNA ligase n=1 Tax=Microbacterium sp. 10M-3C3 TaxID=2483401 RepID=UPI000F63F1F5|nr:ATP-dependent DNA ligase [Microbacterium sp. 10M-3C3]